MSDATIADRGRASPSGAPRGEHQADPHPPCRVLGRQRQAGGVLLPQMLRVRSGRLQRAGDRRPRPRELRAAAGQHVPRAHARRSRHLSPHERLADMPRRRRARHRLRGGRRRRQAYATAVARGAGPVRRTARRRGMPTARCAAPSIRTYGDTIHSFIERGGYGGFLPGFALDSPRPQRRPALHRSRRRQRRAATACSTGATSTHRSSTSRSSSATTTRTSAPTSRRCAARSWPTDGPQHHVPDQRAGAGASEEPDPGVHRLQHDAPASSTSRCSTDDILDDDRARCATTAPISSTCPTAITTRSGTASATSTRIASASATCGSWSTATTRATCCSSSRGPCRIGRPSSSK